MGAAGSTGRLGRRSTALLAIVAVVGLIGTACSKSSGTSGPPALSVFVQKFRFHGLATSVASGNVIVNFTNRESLPITHELVLISLPSGKKASDVIAAAKATDTKSEDGWLHFGEIPEVNTGATKSGLFDLPAGTYALACWQTGNLGGGTGKAHAARGMVFQFTVT